MLAWIDMEEAKLEGRVLDKSSNTVSKILKQHGIAKDDWMESVSREPDAGTADCT